ncbi:uncharacterized protein [Diabrotica undecimpunctata]|uniref:uncharacterized protein n=1 Tax=Diabrotica undecimpunctata TaxID=50387 RepID=UPI003B6391B0
MFIKYLFISIAILGCVFAESEYFEWKDYNRTNIPDNAVVVDAQSPRGTVYLGVITLVDTENIALIPVNVVGGAWYVNVTLGRRPYVATKNIKIACHKDKDLVWRSANQTVFASLFDRDDYTPLQIGWEANSRLNYNASIYVGQGPTSGGNLIGKIYRGLKGSPYQHEEGILYIDGNGDEVPFQFRGGEYQIAVSLKNE